MDWNGSNGDTEGGAERSWGLSVSILTDAHSVGLLDGNSTIMGHGGDAYGLISKFYFDPDTKSGLILITNGIFDNPTKSSSSVFYDFEEAIFSAARKVYFY